MDNSKVILLVLYLFYGVIENNAKLTNVALFKDAMQSSDLDSSYASLAVDGGTSQGLSAGTCTHTAGTSNQFWEVDLSDTYVIDYIKVFNRQDCCGYRLSNVDVSVSMDNVNYVQFGYHPGEIGSTFEFRPESPLPGRWVKIFKPKWAMTLCEVQVMSNKTYHKDWFKIIESVKGAGLVIDSKTVVSQSQCAFLCNRNHACHSANVRRTLTSSPEMECELLSSFSYHTMADPLVTHLTLTSDLDE